MPVILLKDVLDQFLTAEAHDVVVLASVRKKHLGPEVVICIAPA